MFKKIIACISLICTAGFSHAGIITQNLTVDRERTNFDTVLVFNLFDSKLGTRLLESVTFELFARSSGSISVENLNPSATVIMATLSTDIILSNSLTPILIETNPSITKSETLAGYDGTTDFDGPSGTEFLNLMTNDFGSMTLTDIDSLALYLGMGTTSVDFTVTANSSVSGGGNISEEVNTFASGDLSVIYTYRDAAINVSAPSSFGILSAGLLSFACFRRFNK